MELNGIINGNVELHSGDCLFLGPEVHFLAHGKMVTSCGVKVMIPKYVIQNVGHHGIRLVLLKQMTAS